VTEIADLIHRTYFYGIRQMGMKDRSLIDVINLTLIALPLTVIHNCVSAWKTCEFMDPPEFGPGGGAQRKCNTRIINHPVYDGCKDVFHHLDAHFGSSLAEIQGKMIEIIRRMIR